MSAPEKPTTTSQGDASAAPTDPRVEAELVRRMLAIHKVTRYIPVVIMVAFLWNFWGLTPHWVSYSFLGAYFISTVSFDLIRTAYARAADRDANYRFWGNVYAAASAWAGLCWGALGGVYTRYDALWPKLAAMLVLLTMVSLAVIGRSYYRPAYYAFTAAAALPFLASLLMLDEPTSLVIAAGWILFFLSQSAWANSTNDMYRKTIALGYENTALVERLRAAVVAAETANKAKSQFLANMSHEIRTPMNGVVGTLELLDTPTLPPEQAELLRVARDSADSLLSIINDVLDLSRIEAAKLKLAHAPFSPADALKAAVETYAALAAKKGIRLSTEIDPSVPARAIGDALRLRQIAVNLIANAVKFTDVGDVTLNVRAEAQGDKARLVVSVVDTGIGISPSMLPKLFRPFEQADSTSTRRHGGTGLGLAICRELIELMGGSISVESEEGRGSTFRFTVMLDSPTGGFGEQAGEIGGLRGSGQRVLVVDDSPVNTRIAALQLDRLGYAADVAANGQEALAAVAQNAYAAVLLDVQMPGQDGYAVARAIRDFEKSRVAGSKRLPIVALTANVLAGEAERCRDAGMDDYMSKPLSMDKLGRVLSRWVGVPLRPKGSAVPPPPELPRRPVGEGDPDVDVDALREMLGGAAHLVRPMLDLYVETAGARMDQIAKTVAERDAPAAAAVAHALKGESANAAARRLSRLAAELEAVVGTRDWSAADRIVGDIQAGFARAKERIAAFGA